MDGNENSAACRTARAAGAAWRWVAGGVALVILLAGCSAGGGSGINLPAFDSGTGASASPPVIQGTEPSGQYAFVYANQIWVKLDADSKPRQLTHFPTVASAYFAWGPLVWSPDGSNIAFVLVRDLTTDGRPRGAGPLYIVDTAGKEDVQATAATASVYGHTYSWYGDNALLYSTGSSINVYDYSDPSDPRAYPALDDSPGPSYTGGALGFASYGDLQVVGQFLYATRFDVTALGATGQVGRAHVVRFFVSPSPREYSGGRPGFSGGDEFTSLGIAYSGAHGELLTGAWSIASDDGEAYQVVQSVDTKAGTVTAKTCYADNVGNFCAKELFQQAVTQPYASPPQLAFSRGGSLIALAGQQLYTEARDGSQYSAASPGGWGTPPQWAPGAKYVVATQLVSSSTDARDVVHFQTNLVSFTLGAKPAVLITGAQDFSWAP
ncbi:MAG TPA: hypothetical protein VGR57_18550 [Ktedonobacterales bacterium]|nr:hypothetical protein [Ktedonobacterales bacterium]